MAASIIKFFWGSMPPDPPIILYAGAKGPTLSSTLPSSIMMFSSASLTSDNYIDETFHGNNAEG